MKLVRMMFPFLVVCLLSGPVGAVDIDVTSLGAIGDGEFDNTAIFQKALDEVHASGGGVVAVPAGRYAIRGHLVIPDSVTLQGTYRIPPTSGNEPHKTINGTVLLAYEGRNQPEAEPFIRLAGSGATLAGVAICYPEWSQKTVPPIPYPPCVASYHTDNTAILDCLLVNPYEGIRLEFAARFVVRNVHGYPQWRGLLVDECYDIGRIENCHFWPFSVIYQPKDPYCEWINLNGVAFEFARTDWQYVLNTFCFGYGVGYKFSEYEHGGCNGNFLGIGADSCERAILVEQSQPAGLLITNGEFVGRWSSNEAVAIEVQPTAVGKVSFSNCSFWGPLERCILHQSPTGPLSVIGCHFENWNIAMNDAPAIDVVRGSAIIQGNTFNNGDISVRVGKEVGCAVIQGNLSSGPFRIDNLAGERTNIGGNGETICKVPEEALACYRLDLGQTGDGTFLRNWYAAEPGEKRGPDTRTWRWSSAKSRLWLPVTPGQRYHLRMKASVRTYNMQDGNGLYCEDTLVAPIVQSGTGIWIEGETPAVSQNWIDLRFQMPAFVPSQTIPGSTDNRALGIKVDTIEMTMIDQEHAAKQPRYDLTRQVWISNPEDD